MEPAPTQIMEPPYLHSPSASQFASRDVIRFGSFSVQPSSRLLICNGKEVPIGGQAFDLLLALLGSRGQLVDKDTIANFVWPSVTVDESNIRFQVGVLRKALGPDGCLIKTIPGRGYLLADAGTSTGESPNLVRLFETGVGTLPSWLRSETEGLGACCPEESYIAVIDDDVTVLDAMIGLLRCAGFNAEPFPSTKEFLESCQTCAPRCIVLDAWLPGQGGLDFQACLISSGIRIPIVFISGHGDVAMSVRAVKAGAFDFLTKPVRYEDLLQAINMAVAKAA